MPSPGLFIMQKEQRADIPTSFDKKSIDLLPYIQLWLNLLVSKRRIISEYLSEHQARANLKLRSRTCEL